MGFFVIFLHGASLGFSEDLGTFDRGEELEAGFGEFAGFFHGLGNLNVVAVFGAKLDEMGVFQRVFNVLVAEELHDVEDVFRVVIEHRGLPMAYGFEGDLEEHRFVELSR